MDTETVASAEAEIGEVVRAAKALFDEFGQQIGRSVARQEITEQKLSAFLARVGAELNGLVVLAEAKRKGELSTLETIEVIWKTRIEDLCKSVAQQNQALQRDLLSSVESRVSQAIVPVSRVAQDLERAHRRHFIRTQLVRWALPLTATTCFAIALGRYLSGPHVSDVADSDVRSALARLGPCVVRGTAHVCIDVEEGDVPDNPRVDGRAMVVKGL